MFISVVRGQVQKYRHWCLPVYEKEKAPDSKEEALKL
jgi:hypothetical protein